MTLWRKENYGDSKKDEWLPDICGEKGKDE